MNTPCTYNLIYYIVMDFIMKNTSIHITLQSLPYYVNMNGHIVKTKQTFLQI